MPIQFQEFLTGPAAARESAKCALFAEVVSRCGQAKFKAWGTSMVPSIRPGDTLIVERRQISGFAVGDVAVYLRLGRLFAHRVTRMVDGAAALITRGDAMDCDDPPVLEHEVIGRVASVVPSPRVAYRLRRRLAALRNALTVVF